MALRIETSLYSSPTSLRFRMKLFLFHEESTAGLEPINYCSRSIPDDPGKTSIDFSNPFTSWWLYDEPNNSLKCEIKNIEDIKLTISNGVELNSKCDCSLQKSKKVTWFCVGVVEK